MNRKVNTKQTLIAAHQVSRPRQVLGNSNYGARLRVIWRRYIRGIVDLTHKTCIAYIFHGPSAYDLNIARHNVALCSVTYHKATRNMGYKRDQNYDGETFRTTSTGPEDVPSELPPPYRAEEPSTAKIIPALPPRQSVAAVPSSSESRRKLLLIYVHGFTGNETSFQKFPTDVHELAGRQLLDAYTVQSIVYPKYKSRKKIDFARDEFSSW